jgi:RND superfamily putative drug exporter
MAITTQPAFVPSGLRPTGPLGRLAGWCYRHRRRVVLGWVALFVLLSGLGATAGSSFRDTFNGGHTQSQQAATLLQRQFPAASGDEVRVVFDTAAPVGSPPTRARVAATLAGLRHLGHVSSVVGPFDPGAADQVSRTGHIAYAVVRFDRSGDGLPLGAARAVVDRARAGSGPGFDVQVGGTQAERTETPKFATSEGLGILAAMVILLVAFGSLIAMALPIATALVAVATTFGILDLLSHAMAVPSFGPELAALVGLGVGIDYALFVVARYRSELRSGAVPETAVATAMDTSGRAVVFAGSTVVLSLTGLFLLGLPFMYGAAIGTILAVLLVMAASITLLPAALGFAGTNIDRFRVGRRRRLDDESSRFWTRWSMQVQRRPWATGGAALLTLVLLAVPFVSLRLGSADAGTDPSSYTTRQAFDLLAKGFGPGSNGPLQVAVQMPPPGDRAAVAAVVRAVSAQPDVAGVAPPTYSPTGTAAVITVVPATAPQASATSDLVKRLRHVLPAVTAGTGVHALVGGETAATIDTSGVIGRHLPLVLGFVIVLSLVLLTRAFRSVLIPVASAVLTLLSTAVAYGVVVAGFEWGWLGSGVDSGTTAPVDAWVPVMLFTILFGLSMDYQVFLVTRIREQRAAGLPDSVAVTRGLASTGRVITSAAAIMICVFAAFVLGDLRVIRLFGLGMAVAIFVDATLVRMILMPAVLQVTGRASWWMPSWSGRGRPVPAEGR